MPGNSKSQYANAQGYGLGAQAVAYAARFLGVPYVWGGTSPSGFDCSGLVQYVYKHLGITLPRTTFDQYKTGTSVSRSNLQPGDLLFFNSGPGSSPTNPGHVSIYAGNGQEIVASTTGKPVMRRAVNWSSFIGARRPPGVAGGGGDFAGGTTNWGGGDFGVNGLGDLSGTDWLDPSKVSGALSSEINTAASNVGNALLKMAIIAPLVIGGGALVVLGFWRGVTQSKGGS